MDWNVFFSTVSQTSGAIVGIFAAFLITKIVANQSEYSKNIDKAAEAITAYFGLSGHLFRFHPARRFGVIRPA